MVQSAFETLTSSESNEWYTPPWVFERVRQIGQIGLDPASNPIAQQWIQAERWHGLPANGLPGFLQTDGLLWLNPPYGKKNIRKGVYGAGAWIRRAIAEYQAGSFPHAVLLVKGDSTGIRQLERSTISCETKRISFIDPNDPDRLNPIPGFRFWFLGPEEEWNLFAGVFGDLGPIRVPYRCGGLKSA